MKENKPKPPQTPSVTIKSKLFKINVNISKYPSGNTRYKSEKYIVLVLAFSYSDALEAAENMFEDFFKKNSEMYIKSAIGHEIQYDTFLNIIETRDEN
ncbi:MAG: hypothetical protein LBE36_06465 [Flavobacteriaceae bacterium]|jgi:hypothetical protein|nr:hypothetical protein [Flavobacteriaceae bacterium]